MGNRAEPIRFCFSVLSFLSLCTPALGAESQTTGIRILEVRGTVEISRAGAVAWDPAYTNQVLVSGDRCRTADRSHVLLRLHDLSLARYGERSLFTIEQPAEERGSTVINFFRGLGYFFSRERPERVRVKSGLASAAVRGTEFVVEVDETQRLQIALLDGEVELTNSKGSINLRTGEQGIAEPGRPPFKTSVLDATNVVQWLLYYPGVLDVSEAGLAEPDKSTLRESLDAYQAGDLPQALARYPAGRVPQSASEKIFYAALLLAAAQVEDATKLLETTTPTSPLADALRELISAVQGKQLPTNRQPASATGWLVRSYTQQKNFELEAALISARRATEESSNFGFAWARVAELEFSFGHIDAAERALVRSISLTPRNAEAHALRGFIFAAQNRIDAAIRSFDTAIAIDSALGNAWLGRGLCRIRVGDRRGGIADLEVAAALEPNRSVLRSYLGKGFTDSDDVLRAQHELHLARRLDPGDPTPWLYAALLHKEMNLVNRAVQDLERSVELNDNRAVYRSRLLLDQDRAVRSASLATIYRRAGMEDVSVREAARAVSDDYANHSAHQFLSESFNALRDPTRFNLRYETVWFNELLLANMLAPVGAGTLSQNITYQEYSRLFTGDGLGFASDSLWRSDRQFFELASQYGTFGNTTYALDLDYQHNAGIRPNNELDRIEWYTRIKQQLTPQDSLFLIAKYQDYHSGDNFQYFFPTNVRQGFVFDEYQRPIIMAGYHREWSPGIHTLLLGGRLAYDQRIQDTNAAQLILFKGVGGQVTAESAPGFDLNYRSEFEAWSAELNQIVQLDNQTLNLGARFQDGHFRTRDRFDVSDPSLASLFQTPAAQADNREHFQRISGYGYYTVEPITHLQLTAGVSYDVVTFPATFRNPPVTPGDQSRDQISPKAAVVWSPRKEITLRGVYTRSLGGVTLDESFRLEPSQLAGFPQAFRTLISESIVGSVSAPEYQTAGLALDLKFPTRTYIGLIGEWARQEVHRTVGVFDFNNVTPPIVPSSTEQQLDYDETTAGIGLNQLLGEEWGVGIAYRFTRSELHSVYPAIPVFIDGTADRNDRSDLHQINLSLVFNHPSGFFARVDNNWFIQDNWSRTFSGSTPATTTEVASRLPSETLPMVNLLVGYRFPHRFGDLTLGVLNLADRDYHLNPLNLYSELPRERVWMARLRVVF